MKTKEEIIEILKDNIKTTMEIGGDLDATSWEFEEGILISVNEAKCILELLSSHPLVTGYSEEQVKELLKQQREICANKTAYPYLDEFGCVCNVPYICLNAPEPEDWFKSYNTPNPGLITTDHTILLPPAQSISDEIKNRFEKWWKENRRMNWLHEYIEQNGCINKEDAWKMIASLTSKEKEVLSERGKTIELLIQIIDDVGEVVKCGKMHKACVWFKTKDNKKYKLSVQPTIECKEDKEKAFTLESPNKANMREEKEYKRKQSCPKCGIVPAKGGGCINHSDCPYKKQNL